MHRQSERRILLERRQQEVYFETDILRFVARLQTAPDRIPTIMDAQG